MKKSIPFALLTLLILASVAIAVQITPGSTIAFNRGGDIWLMEADGSNQRSWVAGITNARGKMSWSPDNKTLVFARQGQLQLQYPDGGAGYHKVYDLFYAYADSSGNFWEGITETLGAFAPQFTADGSKILFVHNLDASIANSILPKYRLCLLDTKSMKLRDLELEAESKLVISSPTISPDGKQVAFVVMKLRGQQFAPLGIVVAAISEFPLSDAVIEKRAGKMKNAGVPSWSPDGKWIAYVSTDRANPGLYIIKPDLTGKQLVHKPKPGLELNMTNPDWSPDSKMLLFCTVNGSIYKVSTAGGETIRLSGPGNDQSPAWCN